MTGTYTFDVLNHTFLGREEREIENLFRKYHAALCQLAWRILADEQAAKDVVQDVFLVVWRKRRQLNLNYSLKGYLYKAVSNASLNRLRKQIETIKLHEQTDAELSRFDEVVQRSPEEIAEALKTAINRLPPKCKTIFVLSKYEGFKYREIAALLDLSMKTVETQMSIALKRLRSELKPLLEKCCILFIFLLIQ